MWLDHRNKTRKPCSLIVYINHGLQKCIMQTVYSKKTWSHHHLRLKRTTLYKSFYGVFLWILHWFEIRLKTLVFKLYQEKISLDLINPKRDFSEFSDGSVWLQALAQGIGRAFDRLSVAIMGHLLAKGFSGIGHLTMQSKTENYTSVLCKNASLL